MMRKSGFARIQLEMAVIKITSRDLLKEASASRPAASSVSTSPQQDRLLSEPAVDSAVAGARISAARPAASPRGEPLNFSPVVEPDNSIATATEDMPAAAAPSLTIEDIRRTWPEVLQKVKSEKISAALFLMEGKPEAVTGQTLVINFPPQFVFYKEALERAENRSIIEKYLKEVLAKNITVKFFIVEAAQDAIGKPDDKATVPPDARTDNKDNAAGTPKIQSSHPVAGLRNAQNGDVLSEPMVKAAVDIFKGRIARR
jgi:DNA polymerase-3 subunit gamma/tau